jgi:hypothetical protein
MNRKAVDTRTREEILARYRTHAARFTALAGGPDRVEPFPGTGWASAAASGQPAARQQEILQPALCSKVPAADNVTLAPKGEEPLPSLLRLLRAIRSAS